MQDEKAAKKSPSGDGPVFAKESALKDAEDGAVQVSTVNQNDGIYDPTKESRMTRLGLTAESFKRAPGLTTTHVVDGVTDLEAPVPLQNAALQTQMKTRHLSMIAVGGSIGTGLFVGSGSALADGGPAGIVLCWITMGIMLFFTTQGIAEMAIMYPVTGGFYTLMTRFIDEGFGFAMGWNYWFQWAVTLPLELVVCGFTVEFWNTGVNLAVWITVFAAIIFILNIFGTWGFAEEEYWSSWLKLITIGIFLFSALIFVLGGGPASGDFDSYWGARLWYNPGAFANGFKGVCSVFVTAAFSFAGTELVGLAAVEHPNPRKALPKAIKMTAYRIIFVFIATIFFISLVVPYDNPDLVGGNSDANNSPLVIMYRQANVSGMPDFINVVILVSVLSIGMSSVYGGSRTLQAMGEMGYAPKCFAYVDKAGRPLLAVASVLVFFPLAYIQLVEDVGDQVFDWLLAVSGLATIFTWLAINITHIRFRMAWKRQGHHIDELPFRAFGGIWGSALSAVILVLVLVAQFYVALFPLGGTSSASERVTGFFQSYLAAPVVILFYIIGYALFRKKPKPLVEIDLVSGRKCWMSAEALNEERAKRSALPWPQRIIMILFR